MIYIIIGAVILILVLIVLMILLIPFKVSFYLQFKDMEPNGYFMVTWLKIKILKRNIPEEKKEEKKKKERKFDPEQLLNILQQFIDAFNYLVPFIQAFYKSITLERVSMDLILGLLSPFDTAIVNGYIWSIIGILNAIPIVYLSVTPDFQKRRLDGVMEANLRLRLFWIVIEGVKAYTKKPVRELIGSLRKLNK